MNLKSWMKGISEDKDIFSLNIVGTHDCTTQYVQLSKIAKCQDKSIYEQLNMGVRCLDVRVKPSGNRLMCVHSVCSVFVEPSHLSRKMELADVLEHCYRFLDENPSESIILQFKNDNNKHMEKCSKLLFNEYIKPNIDKWFIENHPPRMSEARGKIVLVRRCAMDKIDGADELGLDFSSWVEQDEAVPEPLILKSGSDNGISFVIQDRFKYNAEDKWSLCVKPFLDTAEGYSDFYIINYLSTAGGKLGPFGNAKIINDSFMKYELSQDKYYGIIYTDFPSVEQIEKITKTNF